MSMLEEARKATYILRYTLEGRPSLRKPKNWVDAVMRFILGF
jgi:hypothetical protein